MSEKGLLYPKQENNRKKFIYDHDIEHTGLLPGSFAHIGKVPNTNYLTQSTERNRNIETFHQLKETKHALTSQRFSLEFEYEKNVEKKTLQREINDRVQAKLNNYEQELERRREKLRNLLHEETRTYYYETVENAQKRNDMKFEDMKKRAEMLKAQEERERLEIVKQKKIEQYSKRCQDLLPKIIKRNLLESKSGQLQQMRENEARRNSDRELDRMWHEFTLKEIEIKKKRELEEAIEKKIAEKKMLKDWDQQMKGKEMLKIEIERVTTEDKIERERIMKEMQQEERNALSEKQQKQTKLANELLKQVATQQKLKEQRKIEENELNELFTVLLKKELEKEKSQKTNTSSQNKYEMSLYRKHLEQLRTERKMEAAKLDEQLAIHSKEVEAKQQEARCKIIEAKLKLQKQVLAERNEQLKFKHKLNEEEKKLQEAENEFYRKTFETNKELEKEKCRLERLAIYEYRQELQKQIEYNNMLREREKLAAEKELFDGQKEEQEYQKIVNTILTGEVKVGSTHPFRRTFEQPDCYCPKF